MHSYSANFATESKTLDINSYINFHLLPSKRILQNNRPDPIRQYLNKHCPWILQGLVYDEQTFGAGCFLNQGWKIHISATAKNALDVLSRTLPLLLDHGIRFKVVNSIENILELNAGSFGPSQVGKFITVYPSSNAEANYLGGILHTATAGLNGPRVPSDTLMFPNGIIYARFGAFRRSFFNEDESTDIDLVDIAGRRFADLRVPSIPDPLICNVSPLEFERNEQSFLPLFDRFILVQPISRGTWGRAYLSIDLQSSNDSIARFTILKHFESHVGMDVWGRDSITHAFLESSILEQFTGCFGLPKLFSVHLDQTGIYLNIELINGNDLQKLAVSKWSKGIMFESREIENLASNMFDTINEAHKKGLIIRDIKPANWILDSSGILHLIDMGIAFRPTRDRGRPVGCGTIGFMHPDQVSLSRPQPIHDIFALGATLYYLACRRHVWAVDKLNKPNIRSSQDIQADLKHLDKSIRDFILNCICHNCDLVKPYAYNNINTISNIKDNQNKKLICNNELNNHIKSPLETAIEIANNILSKTELTNGTAKWKTKDEYTDQTKYECDIYSGVTGIALFLLQVKDHLSDSDLSTLISKVSAWINSGPWTDGRRNIGLFSGESGIGLFFIRVAEALKLPSYIFAAKMRAKRIADIISDSYDLVAGESGRLVFLCELASITDETLYKQHIKIVASNLLKHLKNWDENWEMSQHKYVSEPQYWGLLHGLAGIGLALIYVSTALNDITYIHLSAKIADRLISEAFVSEINGEIMFNWSQCYGDTDTCHASHCHGAGGIAQFLIRLFNKNHEQKYLDAAHSASVAVRSQNRINTCICHGLAGDGMVFLDMFYFTHNPLYRNWAIESFQKLIQLRERIQLSKESLSLDYMTGEAGIGAFALRLANPDKYDDPILSCRFISSCYTSESISVIK